MELRGHPRSGRAELPRSRQNDVWGGRVIEAPTPVSHAELAKIVVHECASGLVLPFFAEGVESAGLQGQGANLMASLNGAPTEFWLSDDNDMAGHFLHAIGMQRTAETAIIHHGDPDSRYAAAAEMPAAQGGNAKTKHLTHVPMPEALAYQWNAASLGSVRVQGAHNSPGTRGGVL